MAKILELQKKDKYNKERTVGSIEIKNQTETRERLRKEVLSLGLCNRPE